MLYNIDDPRYRVMNGYRHIFNETPIEPCLNMICNASTRLDDGWVAMFIFLPEEAML